MTKPILALTMGDAAGIGPEVIVKACLDRRVGDCCRPLIIGHPAVIRRAAGFLSSGSDVSLDTLEQLDDAAALPVAEPRQLICFDPTEPGVSEVQPGQLDARAGAAAYTCLVTATRAALAGQIDGIVTAPLNKAALHLAGHIFPGHTEILAAECGVEKFAMMLFLPPGTGEGVRGEHGLGVAHVTLHTSIRSVPELLTPEAIGGTIELVHHFMQRVGADRPRVGVCALNPHAGEAGLFGDEEARVIAPAVDAARRSGIEAHGPFPADTLMRRAVGGEFDGVAAMYHDQGHIALKLIGFDHAVNVTLGLPIVRTSPSHGTAFEIAGQGVADATGMIGAITTAAQLVGESGGRKAESR